MRDFTNLRVQAPSNRSIVTFLKVVYVKKHKMYHKIVKHII
jgi:hypothetical protein